MDANNLKYCFNTQHIKPGDVFIAMPGCNSHGHNYIADAIKKGASYIVTEEHMVNTQGLVGISLDRVKIVTNSLEYFSNIVTTRRQNFKGRVIGVTGSSGKTSTVNMLKVFLEQNYRVHSSIKNFNNFLGLSHTLANLPEHCHVMVAEIGMSKPKEILPLNHILKPQVAIITNIGLAHIGQMENNQDLIVDEKACLARGAELVIFYKNKKESINIRLREQIKLHTKGAILEVGDGAKIFIENLVFDRLSNLWKVRVSCYEKLISYVLPKYFNQGLIENSLLIIAYAHSLGYESTKIQQLLKIFKNFVNEPGRGDFITLKNGAVLINDSYNANPLSMLNSVLGFNNNFSLEKKVYLLGDMGDLRDDCIRYHVQIGQHLDGQIITLGQFAKYYQYNAYKNNFNMGLEEFSQVLNVPNHYNSVESLLDNKQLMQELSLYRANYAILVKGSRFVKLNLVVEHLRAMGA